MLEVKVHNIFTSKENIADYTFQVRVGNRLISAGRVYNHYRPNGAAALLRRVADEVERLEIK